MMVRLFENRGEASCFIVFGFCFQISHVINGCDTSLLCQQAALHTGFRLQIYSLKQTIARKRCLFKQV